MPADLTKAHQQLDKAVDRAYEAYEHCRGKKIYHSEAERMAFLFDLYLHYTSLLPAEPRKKPKKSA